MDLTDRELEICRLMAHGFEQKQIGERLGISHRTVEMTWRSARLKLGVRNRMHAVAVLVSRGQLKLNDELAKESSQRN